MTESVSMGGAAAARRRWLVWALAAAPVALTLAAADADERPHIRAASAEAAGEYLTVIGGCNDCHTPGWMETNGAIPSHDRLTGATVGFRGPWGTTYPPNLRLTAAQLDSEAWIQMIRTRNDLPPMPWMNLHQVSEQDLRAIHSYLVSLGPAGAVAPAYVPPDQEPETPYILFVPQPPTQQPAS